MRSPHVFRLMSTLIIVFAAAAALADPPDIPVAANGAEPAHGLQVVELEEMWRAGGEDDDVFFGQIFRAVGDAEGNVYLLDTQLSEVPVFSPDGEHLKTLSREGEGPGETRGPVDLTLMPDGSLGILQRFPGTIVNIDLDGAPLGRIPIGDSAAGGFNSLFTGRCKNGHLMMVAQNATMGEGTQTRIWHVGVYDAAGAETHRLWSQEIVVDFAAPSMRENDILAPVMFGSTPGPDGRVYVAPHLDRYEITVYGPDGAPHHVITREHAPRPRRQIERDRVQAVFDVWAANSPIEIETQVNEVAMTVANLYVSDANELWVESAHAGVCGPEAAFLTYDVFTAEGRFDRQVALVCEGNWLNDRLFWARDDMVVVVRGAIPAMYAAMSGGVADNEEEAGLNEMEVVCYRIPG